MKKREMAEKHLKIGRKGRYRLLIALTAALACSLAAATTFVALRQVESPVGDATSASAGQTVSRAPDSSAPSVPEPTPTPAPTPTPEPKTMPENVGLSPDFSRLLATLREEIKAYRLSEGQIDVALAVTDLQTGETVSVAGNAAQKTGCTINLFALLVATEAFQNGEASPDDVAYAVGSGIGGSYPPQVKYFLQVIKGSHQAGVERANELMRSWGLKLSLFDHVPYYGDGTGDNRLTALETNLVLTRLHRGKLFKPKWTQYALEQLRAVQPYLNYILPGQLPAVATVAHKIGYYSDHDGWVNNDSGIVTFAGDGGKEKAYVITYLSQRARSEYSGYSFGAHLSKLVWDYFDAKY